MTWVLRSRVILCAHVAERTSMAMRAANEAPLITADDLLEISIPGKIVELVRGRLIVREPPSTRHGRVQANLTYFLAAFVRGNDIGVLTGGSGYKIEQDPDTVRAPDVGFIPRERTAEIPPRNYAAFAPALLAEVVSPNDRPGEVFAKVSDWLEAGARLVWVIDPQHEAAQVYRSNGTVSLVGSEGVLDGEDILPGFRCPLADVLK
jgi:Uma2 family endonuclease